MCVTLCDLFHLDSSLHTDVVSLGWDQYMELRFVGSLASVRRGDGQHHQIVISDHQFRAVPVGYGGGLSFSQVWT